MNSRDFPLFKSDSNAQKRRKIRFSLSPRKICQIQIEEPTNNRAERALRFGMLLRKRSLGSQNNKGLRWVDRILTLKETCPIKAKAPFSSLVEMVGPYFKEQKPNLA